MYPQPQQFNTILSFDEDEDDQDKDDQNKNDLNDNNHERVLADNHGDVVVEDPKADIIPQFDPVSLTNHEGCINTGVGKTTVIINSFDLENQEEDMDSPLSGSSRDGIEIELDEMEVVDSCALSELKKSSPEQSSPSKTHPDED